MLSSFKSTARNLLIALFILSPIFILSFFVYNPGEKAAISRDEERQNNVRALARATENYFSENSVYPTSEACSDKWISNCLLSVKTLVAAPGTIPHTLSGKECQYETQNGGRENGYCFSSDESRKNIVIYTEAESMAWREFCEQGTTLILYSSFDKRDELVCTGIPTPGKQRFAK